MVQKMIMHKIWPWLLRQQTCNLCDKPAPEQPGLCRACRGDLPFQQHTCPRCALPLHEDSLCADCIRQPPPFLHTFAPFTYRFPFDQLLPAIKYQGHTRHLRWIADCMAARLQHQHLDWPDWLIPVPISRQRLAERGFNQAEILAQALSQRTGIPCWQGVSKRHDSPHQTGLDASTRRRNLKNSFSCAQGLGGHLAVVDDVMTTGSTAREISRLLLQHGASRVDIWVIARTPEKNFY